VGLICLKYMGYVSEDTWTPLDRNPRQRIAKEVIEAAGIRVTAEALSADFAANTIAAEQKYKGKVVEITGEIGSIKRGSSGPFRIQAVHHLGSISRYQV